MKRLDQTTELIAAKRQRQQLPLTATSADSITGGSSSVSLTQSLSQAPCSHLPPATFSTIVLDSTDIFSLVASLLCYCGLWHGDGTDNSLLHFARCCPRIRSLVMRDGPWWKQQCLFLGMLHPLIPFHRWRFLLPMRVALMADGFGARQQEVVRRLLGDKAYNRVVVPQLLERRLLWEERRVADTHLAVVGLALHSHEYTVLSGPPYEVLPKLNPEFFDDLAQLLPEPCRHYLLDKPTNEYDDDFEELGDDDEYDEYEDHAFEGDDDLRSDDNAAYNEPYCQWLLGCWDAVLLPKCTQSITRASIHIEMEHGLPQPYQTACLIHTLSHMSGVTRLSLLWERKRREGKVVHYHPAPLSVSELTDVLPKLASLHISRMPLFPEFVESLMMALSCSICGWTTRWCMGSGSAMRCT